VRPEPRTGPGWRHRVDISARLRRPVLFLLLCLIQSAGFGADDTRPNILLIMADDLGYNDLHIYNRNPLARTPNIDQLARDGVRFTRHYTDTVCEPSRIALLTGRFPARLGGRAGTRGISLDVMTIADSLQAAGYRTHHVGKWHVRRRIRDAWPDRQGFQSYFGFINQLLLDGRQVDGRHAYGQSRYYNPWLSVDGGPAKEYEGHLTELLVGNVVHSIESLQPDQPWFINFWSLAPHVPTQPAVEWGKRYPPTREGRYFALIEQLDDGVRRILEALEKSGQADNTVVVFTSDNGGANLGTDNNAPLQGHKLQYNEGGVRTPLIMRWPGHFARDQVVDQPVALVDLFPTLASIAGAAVPGDLDGFDIQPAIDGKRLPPRAQFYERFHQDRYGFTVLSADGRWRLYIPEPRGHFALLKVPEEPMLYDLWQDPFGWNNVYTRHPDIVAQLEEEYRLWHRGAREIRVTSNAVTGRGLVLTGDDMQRTPGYGGFTFAVDYYPPGSGGKPSGTIAAQENTWSLAIDDSGARAQLEFGEHRLSASLASTPGCNSLVATAHFKITTMRPNAASNRLTMALHHNGRLIGKREIKGIEEGFEETRHGTTVGYAEGGDASFNGILGKPLLLNSYTSASTPTKPADLHAELCPGP
jgi:arylsulfatase A-like enzyme